MNTITKKQAIESGYTLAGKDVGEWQHLTPIDDISDEDLSEEDWFLAEKDGFHPSMEEDDLKELIADTIESNWGNDTGDDTERVYEKIKSMNFEEFANKINLELEGITAYNLTKIKLVKE